MSITALRRPAGEWEDWLEANIVGDVPHLSISQSVLTPAPPARAVTLKFATRRALLEFTYGFTQLPAQDDPRHAYDALHRAFTHLPTLVDGEHRAPPGRRRDAWLIQSRVQLAYWEFTGIDPLLADVWPVYAYDPAAGFWPEPIDWTEIKTGWLRQAVKRWAASYRPSIPELRKQLRCLKAADPVLRASGRGPRQLRAEDADAVWRHLLNLDYSHVQRASWVAEFFGLIAELKATGEPIHHTFIRRRSHTVVKPETDPARRRDLPIEVVVTLDRHLGQFVQRTKPIKLPIDVANQMRRTLYVVTRDTGRRIGEVCTLLRTCIEEVDGQFSLRYDNHKSSRLGRLLPIKKDTAEAVHVMLETLDQNSISGRYLLPASGFGKSEHLVTSTATDMLNTWTAQVPLGDFDPDRLTWHAFRHTYAQRHADAGVDPDVLRVLMDHDNLATTMRYYQVNDDRKRKAVEKMNEHVVDRQGAARPFDTSTRHRIGTVAVPFGLCTEPANVDSGGQGCPIKYQCSGCSHFRTEPSFMPIIQDHVSRLRSDLERARALDVESWTLAALEKEIAGYADLTSTLKATLNNMDPEERSALEEHAAVLRKARATRKMLPLHVK